VSRIFLPTNPVLNFVFFLFRCGEPIYKRLMTLRYQDFITTKDGRDISRSLVTALINQQIAQQISVDTISEVLQSRCGSFCSMDDVKYFKAQESLRKATETANPDERARCLHESLKYVFLGCLFVPFLIISADCSSMELASWTFKASQRSLRIIDNVLTQQAQSSYLSAAPKNSTQPTKAGTIGSLVAPEAKQILEGQCIRNDGHVIRFALIH